MEVRMRILARLGLILGVLALALPAGMATASASYGQGAAYQTAFSGNCDNPSICGTELGGFWGWAVFNNDGSADLELTDCNHMLGGGGSAGASHISVDVPGPNGWFTAKPVSGALTDFWVNTPAGPMDTGIPAAPGHYNLFTLDGFKAPPGFSIQIQVTKIP